MLARGFAERTREAYLWAVAGLARFYRRSPDQISDAEVQAYLVHLLRDRQRSWSTCNIVVRGLRFFFHTTLKRDRTMLLLAYAAGLRLSEVTHLRVADIDSARMTIRVVQGKGGQDRYTLLTPVQHRALRAIAAAITSVPLSGPCPRDGLPRQVPHRARPHVCRAAPHLRRRHRGPGRSARLRALLPRPAPRALGRLRQAALRRAGPGPRVPGPLYPPRGADQSPPRRVRGGPGLLSLEKLRRRRPHQDHDPPRRRIPPRVPPPHRAGWLHAHPARSGSSPIGAAPPPSPVSTASRRTGARRAVRRAARRRRHPAALPVLPRGALGPRRDQASPQPPATRSRAPRLLMIPPHCTTPHASSPRGRRLVTLFVRLASHRARPLTGPTAPPPRSTPQPTLRHPRPRPSTRERSTPSATSYAIQSP